MASRKIINLFKTSVFTLLQTDFNGFRILLKSYFNDSCMHSAFYYLTLTVSDKYSVT